MNKIVLLIDTEAQNEVMWFETIQQAQSYIEPYDADTCRVYTAEGQIIDVFVDKAQKPSSWLLSWLDITGPDKVRLELTNEFDADTLQLMILTYLSSHRLRPELDSNPSILSLVELLKKTQPHS